MANTSSHPIRFNGVRLDTWAYNISTKSGWAKMAGYRGANEVAAGRDGHLWVPKVRDVSTFSLEMWVSHLTVDGEYVQGGDHYYNWRKNLDTLMNILDTSYAPGLLDQEIGNGEHRQALVDNADSLDPDLFGRQFGKFVVNLDVLGGFWEDAADRQFDSPIGGAAVAVHQVTPFAGGTAPMRDLELLVTGPIEFPTVIDSTTGHSITMGASLPTSNDRWYINTKTGVTRRGAGVTWGSPSGQNAASVTTSKGFFAPSMFGIAHQVLPGDTPSVQLMGSGAGAGTRLQIRGRRKYR